MAAASHLQISDCHFFFCNATVAPVQRYVVWRSVWKNSHDQGGNFVMVCDLTATIILMLCTHLSLARSFSSPSFSPSLSLSLSHTHVHCTHTHTLCDCTHIYMYTRVAYMYTHMHTHKSYTIHTSRLCESLSIKRKEYSKDRTARCGARTDNISCLR